MKLSLALTITDNSGVKFSLPIREKLDPFDLTAEPDQQLSEITIETFRRMADELLDQTAEATAGLLDRIQEHAEEQRRQLDPAQKPLPGAEEAAPRRRRSRTLPPVHEPTEPKE